MMLSYFNDIYLIENDSILSEPTTEPTTKNNKPTQITDNQYYFYINSSPSLTAIKIRINTGSDFLCRLQKKLFIIKQSFQA